MPSVVIWLWIEACGNHWDSTGGNYLRNPLHRLAADEMALALWAPQPERRLLGGEDVAVLGVVREPDTGNDLATVLSDVLDQPDLGRCRVVLCLQVGQDTSVLGLLRLGSDPPRIPGHGLGRPPLARIPSQACKHVGHDIDLELARAGVGPAHERIR